jgi:predicted Zn-dependent peptidase
MEPAHMIDHPKRTVLSNGLTIVSEHIPNASACGVGVWLKTGSGLEEGWPGGITHFLEHMNFKGTATRSALEISASIEGRGASLNAATGRGHTSFYTNSLSEDWQFCLNVLADMSMNSVHLQSELEKERAVIIDEIRMVEEMPDEDLYDLSFMDLIPGSAWGRPIQGTVESVGSIDHDLLMRFYQQQTVGNRLVVSAVGDLAHEALVEEADRLFGHLPAGNIIEIPEIPNGTTGLRHYKRDAARQAHVQLCRVTPTYDGDDYDALSFLNTLLGDGMSSRLFQELREDRGLCYNVYSWLEAMGGAGTYGSYFSCDSAKFPEVLDLLRASYRRLATEGPNPEEIQRTHRQLRGGLLLGMESNLNRMVRLAREEIQVNRLVTLEERIQRIADLHVDDLSRVGSQYFDPDDFLTCCLLPSEDHGDDDRGDED